MAASNESERLVNLLRSNIVRFVEDLMLVFPEMPELHIAKAYFGNFLDPYVCMNNFIEFVVPLKDKIPTRDDEFFLNNENIFGSIPESQRGKVPYFKKIWQSEVMTPESKEQVWKYFELYVAIAEKFKKMQ